MHLIFFTHPSFQAHQSMPRYARWLADGMKKRGYTVEVWTAPAHFFKLPVPAPLKKWMGYIDQFLLFPAQVKKKLKQFDSNTLFVFTDHALGPWVPLAASRKHIIHCHDFLAQKSALGQVPQNPTSWSGQQYQAFIRRGYSKGKIFISISYQTKKDLEQLLPEKPPLSIVVYNGVNPVFKIVDKGTALHDLQKKTGIDLQAGFVLHVGGNQWYKNRVGVLQLYTEWRKQYSQPLPLLMIGENPDMPLLECKNGSSYTADIHFLTGLSDTDIVQAYNTATVFLFPSLAEGFGWPIAEAMACGCPVLTTSEAPMTEVGADAAIYIRKMPADTAAIPSWLQEAAAVVQQMVKLSAPEREKIQLSGLQNVERFESEQQLNAIESVYKQLYV